MSRYVVKNKVTNLYLDDRYYKNLKNCCENIENAHKFSAFELLLATKKYIKNKENYVVYNYNQLKNNLTSELIEIKEVVV